LDSIIAVPNNSTTNTGVDVFFVHPTVLSQINDPPQNIVLEEQSEFMVSATILAQAGLMAKYGRFLFITAMSRLFWFNKVPFFEG